MAWKPDYLTLAQFKAALRLTDVVDDAELPGHITAASRAIDVACRRQFGKVDAATTWTYNAVWDRHRPTPAWVIVCDDIAAATGLVVTVAGTAVTDYTLEPRNADAKGKVFTQIVLGPTVQTRPCEATPAVDVTSPNFGWSAFPATIVNACKLQASRFAKRRDAPFGIAGSPNDGSEMRLLERIDPDVRVMVTDYVRWG